LIDDLMFLYPKSISNCFNVVLDKILYRKKKKYKSAKEAEEIYTVMHTSDCLI